MGTRHTTLYHPRKGREETLAESQRNFSPPMQSIISDFMTHLSGTEKAKLTLQAYVADMKSACGFLALNFGPSIDLTNATAIQLKTYIRHLSGTYTLATTNRRIASLRTFYKWLISKKGITRIDNPALELKFLRQHRHRGRPAIINQKELDALLSRLRTASGLSPVRDGALIRIIAETGIKASELISLNLEHCRASEKPEVLELAFKRASKGSNHGEVIFPFSATTSDAMVRYLDIAHPEWKMPRGDKPKYMARPLFVNNYGGRITDRGVRRQMVKTARVAGLSGVCPRALRSFFHSMSARGHR